MKRLVIVGYYGFGNAGDEAILEAMLAALRQEVGEPFGASIVSGDPASTQRRCAELGFEAASAISWRDPLALADAIRQSDLVIVGGGGLFHDYWGADPGVFLTDLDFGAGFFAAPALLASLFEKPVMLYAVGAGPLRGGPARELVGAAAAAASRITVRDEDSAALLVELGADRARVEVAADPVWALELFPTSPRAGGGAPAVAVALRAWTFGVHAPFWEREVARALDAFVAARGASVTFVPFQAASGEAENDTAVAERVRALMVHRDASSIAEPAEKGRSFTAVELAGLFDRHDVVVAMRLHALVLAARRERPFVALSYDPKVTDAAQRLGAGVLSIADLTAPSLAATLAAAVDDGARAVAARRDALEALAASARTSAREAAALLVGDARAATPWIASSSSARRALAQGIAALLRRQRGLADDLAAVRGDLAFSAGEREKGRAFGAQLTAALDAAADREEQLRGELADRERAATAGRAEAEDWKRTAIAARAEADEQQRTTTAARADAEQWKRTADTTRAEVEEWKRASIGTRAEVEDWRRAHARAIEALDDARASLAGWRVSRTFKAAERYWWLRRKLGRLVGRGGQAAIPAAISRPAAAPVEQARAAAAEPAPTGALDNGPVAVEQPRQSQQQPPQPRPLAARSSRLPPVPRGKYDVVVFSIIDWDFRFQRPQQLATQYARHGHRVFFLSTTVFLPPGGDAYELVDKTAGVTEVRLRSRPLDVYGGRLTAEDLDVLAEDFDALARDFSIGDGVAMVEIPFWAPLAERLRARRGWRVLYDCMDEWTNFPGFGADVLGLERQLVLGADLTVVSADRLVDKVAGTAGRYALAKNGVDGAHYRALYGPNELLADVRQPVIGYYGALASWVDVPLLTAIARSHPDATVVLAGGHFDVDLEPLRKLPNVRLLGQRPYEEMPRLLWHFDVCIIPFLVNDITEATNPVKFYEYLTGGKPVVAPALSELLPYRDLCYLAEYEHGDPPTDADRERLLAQLALALREPAEDPRRAARTQLAAENDWSARYETIADATRAAYPLVSVVVVTFGGLPLTRRCLASLLEAETWPHLELVVVDNASSDGTPAWLRELAASDPRVRVVLNEKNLGFAAANNLGLVDARGEVLVLLNNDTVVPPGLLGRLVTHLERDETVGLLCPTTNFCGNEARVYGDYALDADAQPTDDTALASFAAARAERYRGESFDIDVAAMYCVAFRRSLLASVGLLDEAYGVGMFEDDDFSRRVRGAGLRVVCAEDAYVHHVGQASFAKLGTVEYDRIFTRNRDYFEKKWGETWVPHRTRQGVEPPTPRL